MPESTGTQTKNSVINAAVRAFDEYKKTGKIDVLRPFFDMEIDGASSAVMHLIHYGCVFSHAFLNRLGKKRRKDIDFLIDALKTIDNAKYGNVDFPRGRK